MKHSNMASNLIRLSLVVVVVSVVLLLAKTPTHAAQDQPSLLRRIANATGRDPSDLQLLGHSTITLADGRQLLRVKALETRTHEIVDVTLDGTQAVDLLQARTLANARWRQQHGAFTPEMIQRLAASNSNDRLNVLLWLKIKIVPFPQPDFQATTVNSALTPTINQIETERVERADALKKQIAPIQARLQQQLQTLGITAAYASEIAPIVYVSGVTRSQLETIAFLPEVDAIYLAPEHAGPALAIARPAQNALALEDAGYTGKGIKVSVTEGQRAYELNPYLSIAGFYSATVPADSHPTAVAGIIGSQHPTVRGLAPEATIYNANGSITDLAVMLSAIDWGAITATVNNNSWYWDDGTATFSALDRHMDYLVRYNANFVAGAAGNFGNGCTNPGGFTTPYIVSPSKGYNVLTVGNFDDNDTVGWADDAMQFCSSYGDPATDITDTLHNKPEVAAIGTGISSTLVSSNTLTALGPVGTGTSFATPMVSALTANLIQADPNLVARPAALRSIIMATALHNIEGDARFSDKDGAGGIDAAAAAALVERGAWDDRVISATTTFPITFTQFVSRGERTRFVINWLSNPTADYATDPLPADLDLLAWRADGTTLITVSASLNNNFEVVDFIAPASEAYRFTITRTSAWSGDSTRLGTAWWSGVTRLEPNQGYSYPRATPLGEHFAVYPSDWSPSNHWRVFGVHSLASNHDLALNSRSAFDDPGLRVRLTESHAISGSVDFIAVDGNHWPASNQEQYIVTRAEGSGGYRVNWSNRGITLTTLGLHGPYTLTNQEVVAAFDAFFDANQLRQITLEPTGNNAADLAMMLFQSNATVSTTWVQARGGQVAKADDSTDPAAIETLRYTHTLTQPDQLGLIVFSKTALPAEFFVRISLDQLITFNPITDHVYSNLPFSITATASSGLTVTFTTTSPTCAVTPAGLITLIHTGQCAVTAQQVGDASFNAAPAVSRTFTITPASQTIVFEPIGSRDYDPHPFAITATASSGLVVTFTTTSQDCEVSSGGLVTTLQVGTCAITAHQAGNANYFAALDVSQTLSITQADQTIFFAPLPNRGVNEPPFTITATASSGLSVTFTTSSSTCEVTAIGLVTLLRTGACSITAHQPGDENYRPALNVDQSFEVVWRVYLPLIQR